MNHDTIGRAGLGYVQIDAGRVGGITVAKAGADYAAATGVTYVNHTFTSHRALAASIQPYAGLAGHEICEYPAEPKPLGFAITKNHLLPGADGQVRLPEAPGLGMEIDAAALAPYVLDVEIRVKGATLYRTPAL